MEVAQHQVYITSSYHQLYLTSCCQNSCLVLDIGMYVISSSVDIVILGTYRDQPVCA